MKRPSSPAVSVMIPIYNEAPFLSASIESVLSQSMGDFELIIQDDGSTDGSIAMLESYAKSDARIRLECGPHVGIIPTANRLLKRARGDLLIRMDGDDIAYPDRIARLVEAADRAPQVDYFAHGVRYIPRDTLSDGMRRYEAWINPLHDHDEIVRDRFVECVMPNPAAAFRRKLADTLGGYRDSAYPEDYEFFLRAVDAGATFLKLPEVLLDWRDHPERHSRNAPRYSFEQFRALKVRHLLPLLKRDGRPVDVVGYGKEGKAWVRALTEADISIAHIFAQRTGRVGVRVGSVVVEALQTTRLTKDHFTLCALGGRARESMRIVFSTAGLQEPRDVLFIC